MRLSPQPFLHKHTTLMYIFTTLHKINENIKCSLENPYHLHSSILSHNFCEDENKIHAPREYIAMREESTTITSSKLHKILEYKDEIL